MTNKQSCYMFVFEGFSDWEPSLLTAGLKQYTNVHVKTFSMDGKPVRSMGDLKIVPDTAANELASEDIDVLVLPGGTAWEGRGNAEIKPLVDSVLNKGSTIAAICGATVFLGRHGYLNTIKHTSNHIYFLKEFKSYKGEDWYVNKPCVEDGGIITANGTAIVGFAVSVFDRLGVLKENDGLKFWLSFFPPSTMPTVSIEAFASESNR